MKTKLTIIAFFLIIGSANAQNEKIKHFEIDVSINFWNPNSLHLKASNSVTRYRYPDGTYLSTGALSGYGTSLAPVLNIKYYFNKAIGISLGFYMVHMDNELYVQKTDSTFSSYENLADIPNFTLGVTGNILTSKSLRLFYETGIDIIPSYNLEMKFANEISQSQDLDAFGFAFGLYCKTGIKFKIINSLFFQSALMYSYIPAEPEYTNSEGSVKMNEKTNLGGIGLETGLSFNF